MNINSAALGGYIEKRASEIVAAGLSYAQLVAQEFTKLAHGLEDIDEKTASTINDSVTVPLVLAVMAKEAAARAPKGIAAKAKALGGKAKAFIGKHTGGTAEARGARKAFEEHTLAEGLKGKGGRGKLTEKDIAAMAHEGTRKAESHGRYLAAGVGAGGVAAGGAGGYYAGKKKDK